MRFFKRTPDHVALLSLLALSVVLHLGLLPYPFDDAYIHVRVAERLVDEGSPYYNSGQAVMASSSPGWTLLLAALFALLGTDLWPIAAANAFLAVLGALLGAELVLDLAPERASRAVYWPVAGVYLGLVHFSSVGLMETPLALAAALLGLLLYARRRPAAFLVLGAAPFLRPELAVLLIAVLVHQLVRRRLAWPRVALFAAAGSMPFLAYQLYFFGTAVPHTATVKGLVYDLSYGHSLRFFLQLALPGHPLTEMGAGRWLLPGLLLAAILVVLLAGRRRPETGRGASSLLPILLLTSGGIATAYVAARGLVFPWYVPLVSVPLFVALAVLTLRSRSRLVEGLFVLGIVFPCGVDLAASLTAALGDASAYRFFPENARVRRYLQVGAELYARYPQARLLSSEIGGLGHTFRGELLDGVGLITPEALEHHPMPVPSERSAGWLGSIPVDYVRRARPELIVSMDSFAESFIASQARADYVWSRRPIYLEEDLRRAASPTLWGSRHLNVFVRRDIAGTRDP